MTSLHISPEMTKAGDIIGWNSVSVIVPTYNRSHLIRRALRSILNQMYRPAEVIVIDDCSSDDTQSVIAAYSGEIPLTYIRLEENGGGAAARNAGIMRAKGDYVAFLDSDDEWQQSHLLVLMQAALRQSGNFAVAGSALRIGKKPRVLPGLEYPVRRSVAEKLHFVLSAALAFQTSTLLMPRETARRFMFDQHLRRHQDWDLVCRMIEGGVALVLLHDATVKYYVPDVYNVSNTHSQLPSLRFLAKHKRYMMSKTKARFVTLQLMRRRHMGIHMIKYLLHAVILGGIGVKEFLYYAKESVLADNFNNAAFGKKGDMTANEMIGHQ